MAPLSSWWKVTADIKDDARDGAHASRYGDMELVDQMLAGEQQPLSRLITLVDRDTPDTLQIMKEIYPHTGRGYCIGVTGPPGGGKSTLVDRLTAVARSKGLTVGIIAVDPSSPFTGGAVLGDRIRMQQHFLDSGVFIRSMATRGSRGGLPGATKRVIKLLDAFGKDLIMVETVGVGQTELDIMDAVDSVVVVLVPEAGDAIQTMKAGLIEIADIFVVNKADRGGAEQLIIELQSSLLLSSRRSEWETPVLATQAVNNIGIQEAYEQLERHRQVLEETGRLASRREEQRRREMLQTFEDRVREELIGLMRSNAHLVELEERVRKAEIDPYSAASQILSDGTVIRELLSQLEHEG